MRPNPIDHGANWRRVPSASGRVTAGLHSRIRRASPRGGCTLAMLKSFYGIDIGEPSGSTAAATADVVDVAVLHRGVPQPSMPQPSMRRTARFMCPKLMASKENPVRERNSWNALCSWCCQPW
jgi:hypothetical protein